MKIQNTDQIMRADIMTARIQDKNELVNAGDIYVGTGDTPDVIDASAGADGKVAKPTVKNIQTAIREDANRQNGLRLGNGSGSNKGVIELGVNSKVAADNACQIGEGMNSEAESLKFINRTVVNKDGEIFGDYPLGFTKRRTKWSGDTWPKSHADLKDGTIVTDWAYTTSQGYNSEIAFVSMENQTADRADLNLVIDGNIYVDDGERKVLAEGDTLDVNSFTSIKLENSEQLVQKIGIIVTKSCTFYTDNEVVLEKGLGNIERVSIPANAQGLITTDKDKKLTITYTISDATFDNYETIKHCYYDQSDVTWKNSLITFIGKPIYSAINGEILQPIKRKDSIYYPKSVSGGIYYFSCNDNKVNFGLVYYDGTNDVSAVAPLYTFPSSGGAPVLNAEYLLYIHNNNGIPYIYLYKKDANDSSYSVASGTIINYRKM